MNNSKKQLKILKEKIDHLQHDKVKRAAHKRNGASFGFKISAEIVAALIVGVGIGLLVDNYFNSKPLGLIIFFILGSFAGFLNVYRVMRRIEKQKNF
jgi:ATP synthase protein I